jgi:hypothetical protein
MLPGVRRAASVAIMATATASSIAPRQGRGWFLTLMTILFVVLAFSDFTKAIQFHNAPERGGLVLLGHKLQGVGPNAIAGPLFGIFLLLYAFGIWRLRAWVLPIAIFYAFWVPVNEVMFWSLHGEPPHPTVGFIVFYLFVSLVGSIGTAIYLTYHRERLS